MRAVSAVVLLSVLSGLLACAVWQRTRVLTAVSRFFTEPGPAFNLAVARIVFFAVVLGQTFSVGLAEVRDYSRLPSGLVTAPHVLGGLLVDLPINPTWVALTWAALIAAGVLGLLGIFPRVAAVVVVIAGYYYFGVPQLYGKVDHDHHIILIGAIFTVSASADTLSVLAVWRAWRRPRSGSIERSAEGRQYALPIRFIWLIMGLLYLSAGLAKYRFDGLRWLEPNTLRHLMHVLWLQAGNYRPPLVSRPDRFGPFLTVGAGYTLVFELTFLLWLFSRRARPFLALSGLVFHGTTNVLLRISFWTLQAFYVTLIDWDRLSRWIFTHRPPMRLMYEGGCPRATKVVGVLQAIVPPGSITFVRQVAAPETGVQADGVLVVSNPERAIQLMVGNETCAGRAAYVRIARRVPVLWPLSWRLWGRLNRAVGGRAQRNGVDQSTSGRRAGEFYRGRPRSSTGPVIAVGSAVLLMMMAVIVPGLRSFRASQASIDSWPIAAYPSFAGASGSAATTVDALAVQAVSVSGEHKLVDLQRQLPFMAPERLSGLTARILSDPDMRRKQGSLDSFICALRLPPTVASVRVLQQRVLLDPEHAGDVVGSQRLLDRRLAASASDLPGPGDPNSQSLGSALHCFR